MHVISRIIRLERVSFNQSENEAVGQNIRHAVRINGASVPDAVFIVYQKDICGYIADRSQIRGECTHYFANDRMQAVI